AHCRLEDLNAGPSTARVHFADDDKTLRPEGLNYPETTSQIVPFGPAQRDDLCVLREFLLQPLVVNHWRAMTFMENRVVDIVNAARRIHSAAAHQFRENIWIAGEPDSSPSIKERIADPLDLRGDVGDRTDNDTDFLITEVFRGIPELHRLIAIDQLRKKSGAQRSEEHT